MPTRKIQYRFAVLLCIAVAALVLNPVLHAYAHGHLEHYSEGVDHVSEAYWFAENLCPFCEAVFQHAASTKAENNIAPAVFNRPFYPGANLYTDFRLYCSSRLRAPPFLACK